MKKSADFKIQLHNSIHAEGRAEHSFKDDFLAFYEFNITVLFL
jgi:hypothetical protein